MKKPGEHSTETALALLMRLPGLCVSQENNSGVVLLDNISRKGRKAMNNDCIK
jgi:hypothetical protein